MNLNPQLLRAIGELGFEIPMPIQNEVIPQFLNSEDDLIGLAQTGTGKTAAYGLPILQLIDAEKKVPQALILAPTRELCVQIANDLKTYTKYQANIRVTPIYGGASFQGQLKELSANPQVIVATPGRMIDMIDRGNIKLNNVQFLVLDEADEMLNMGFEEDVSAIIENTPKNRRTFLFSATMPSEVEQIALRYMHKPVTITVGERGKGATNIKHLYYVAHARDRYNVLKRIVDYNPTIYGIIFCRTRQETQDVADSLIRDGYSAESLHGDLSQSQRDYVMNKFRIRHLRMLVATDVAARGIDVDDLTHVINYNLPDELETYIHRSGRTGRAGRSGISVSIINLKEKFKIKMLEKKVGKEFFPAKIPSGHQICEKQLYHLIDTMEKVEINEDEIDAFMPVIFKKIQWMSNEELIKRFVSVEFNRFLDFYRDSVDLNIDETRVPREKDQGYTRCFISLGRKDGLLPPTLLGFINETFHTRVPVGKIEMSDTYTFLEIGNDYTEKFLKIFSDIQYNRRSIRVDVAARNQERKFNRKTKETNFRDERADSNLYSKKKRSPEFGKSSRKGKRW